MERLSWWARCIHKSLYKTEAGGSESGRDAIRRETEVREGRRYYVGFDDGGRGHEPRKYRRPLEIEKDKETNFP